MPNANHSGASTPMKALLDIVHVCPKLSAMACYVALCGDWATLAEVLRSKCLFKYNGDLCST